MTEQLLNQRYEFQRVLAKQAGRKTILARDLETKDLVVIKLLTFGDEFEWQGLKLFEREAQTLQDLSHPSIPRYLNYLDIDETGNKGFALVQSYVEGKSLEEHLKAGRTFSEEEVKELAKSLLEILIYLHDREPPVIHRDIKPSNIILNNRSAHSVGQIYLVDFGSVQNQAAKFGGTITVVGTYGYMPPEQFGGRTTPASDIYSLGTTLIYLVTGKHPTELQQKDFRIQFQKLVNLSPSLVDWLEWMTEPSLDERLSSATEALHALENPRIRNKHKLEIEKPLITDLILKKSSEFIEIIIQPKGLNFGTIAWISPIVPLFLWSGNFIPSMIGTYGFTLATVSALVVVARIIIFALFKKIHLVINSEKIYLVNSLLGFRWKHHFRPTPRHEIVELKVSKEFPTINRKGEHIWHQNRLIIQAGNQKYELGENNDLTEAEVNWLAQELSDWLELPITRK